MATNGASNLSFVLEEPGSVAFEERPVPELESPHDVLVAVAYTGICGSDVHYWRSGGIGEFVVREPMVLGHESAGVVVRVGPSVTGLRVGDRVAVEPGKPCRRCDVCIAGHYNLCPSMSFAATPPVDGTLTGFWATPADLCYRLPDNVSLPEGALMEPLAVAVHVTRAAGVSPGCSVVVMGAGPIGLLCCAVARAYGASTIVAVDLGPARIAFAAEYAATHTYLAKAGVPAADAARAIKELAGLGTGYSGGADVVVDASGAESSIQTAIETVRRGGFFLQAGMGKPSIMFPILALCCKEVTMKGSFRYSAGDYRLAVELVATGKVDVKKLITGTVPFAEAEDAFKRVSTGKSIKTLIAGPNQKI